MWDLTVPGNNDHDFYVLPVQAGIGHTYYVKTGYTAVLAHNCGESPNDRSGQDFTDKGRQQVRSERGCE